MDAIVDDPALNENEHRPKLSRSCEPGTQRVEEIIMEDVADPEPSSNAFSQDNSPSESHCGQNGAANGDRNQIQIKEENVVKVAGTDRMAACDSLVCTCLQGCHESGPQMQEYVLPSHLQPGALLRSDSLLMDADVEIESGSGVHPAVNILGRLSPSHCSCVHTPTCLEDRASQAETRVKQQCLFAATRQQTGDDADMYWWEIDTQKRRFAKKMEQVLTYVHCSTGKHEPLCTRFDCGADYSVVRKDIVTRGFAKLYRQPTAVTLEGVFGGKVTTNEFTLLPVRCRCFGVDQTIRIKFFLVDDKLVSGYDAYLGAFDLKETNHLMIVSCEDRCG